MRLKMTIGADISQGDNEAGTGFFFIGAHSFLQIDFKR